MRKLRIFYGERIRHILCWLSGGHVWAAHGLLPRCVACMACGKVTRTKPHHLPLAR